MNSTMTSNWSLLVTCALPVLALTIGAPAYGQSADTAAQPTGVDEPSPLQAENPDTSQGEDIVVTGTLIRGVAPTGTNVVSVSQQDILVSGATTANDILGTVPQVTTNFGQVRSLGAGASGITALSPSIRNLGASGATTTLLLLDGHRMPNAGVISTTPDPDVIPPGVLERVEVVPDGGSSIYGSDAVGGVINFITRKKFDGVEVRGRYGFADNYNVLDLNVTAGSDWESGSGYVSYSYLHNDEIFGRDRDFLQQVTANAGTCGAGTVFSLGIGPSGLVPIQSYALPDRVPGTITDCDTTDDQTLQPKQTRHSVFAGLHQEIMNSIEFDVRGFYTTRKVRGRSDSENAGSGGGGVTATIRPVLLPLPVGTPFPGYIPVAGDTGLQQVAFNYDGLIDDTLKNDLNVFQITPSVTAPLGGGWQLRVLGSYGQSSIDTFNQLPNLDSQTAAIAAGTLNPYNPSATSPAVLATIFRDFIGEGDQTFLDGRIVVDGPLFRLPGGDVKVAAGAEFLKETIDDIIFGEFPVGTDPDLDGIDASRKTKALFGELVVPVVGTDNAMGGVHSLTLSFSGRYDHYSDFGGTVNPKIGFTYEPVDWWKIRGNWGKSFNAPSLSDTHAADTRSFPLPAFLAPEPGDPSGGFGQFLIVLVGGNPNLGPQKAKTWSIGVDVEVPPVPGLTLSATYYNIKLKDQIAFNTTFYTPETADFWIRNPTQEQVEAAIAEAPPFLGPPVAAFYPPFGTGVYSLLDFRRQNLAKVNQAGIDFNVQYKTQTSFGTVFGGMAGTYTLHRDTKASVAGDFVDALKTPGASDLAFLATVGGTYGNFTGTVSWNHLGGYSIDPDIVNARFGTQTSVDSFDTVDLFLQYDVKGEALLEDLAFTLNVENLFNEDPPFYSGPSAIGSLSGFTNGSTLGRLISLGVRKQF